MIFSWVLIREFHVFCLFAKMKPVKACLLQKDDGTTEVVKIKTVN